MKTTTAIGLDIGNYSVKCVEVTHGGGTIQLKRVSILPMSDNKPETLQKLLKVMFDVYQGKPPRVRISVSSGSSLIIRRISLPVMSATELRSAIVFEAEGLIPFPIDQCMLDFQILGNQADGKNMNVMLVAAKKDFLSGRLQLLQGPGLTADVIDVDIFCLINSFEMLGDNEGQRVYGLLNIGHQMSSFAILQDKAPYFVREISQGGIEVTKALAEMKGIAPDAADQMKIEKKAEDKEVLIQATQRGFEHLVDQLKHSTDYFENETGEELKTIWMSGGGALAEGTAAFLSSELGKDVKLWNNLKKMEVFGAMDEKYLAEHSMELNVALGMVLRDAEPKK